MGSGDLQFQSLIPGPCFTLRTQLFGFPDNRLKLVDLADLGGHDRHPAAGEHGQAHRPHLHHAQRPVQQVIAGGQTELEAPPILVHEVGKRLGQRRGVGILVAALGDRHPLQTVNDVGDGDVLRAAAGAEVAGDARPHRVGRQHGVPIAGVDHGDQRAGRILHVGAAGAGAAAASALETVDEAFPARRGLDHLLQEGAFLLGRMCCH